MLSKVLAQAFPQPPGAVAVDEPQVGGAGEKRLIERLLRGVDRLFQTLADEMDLEDRSGKIASGGDRASRSRGRLRRRRR